MKVLIIHFRSAPGSGWKPSRQFSAHDEVDSVGTDGVSLEIMKRRNLLEAMGNLVAICSAYDWAEFPLPALEFDSEETRKMMRNLFGRMEDFATEAEFKPTCDFAKSILDRYYPPQMPNIKSITKNNIAVAKRSFNFDVLRAHLRNALNWADSVKARQ